MQSGGPELIPEIKSISKMSHIEKCYVHNPQQHRIWSVVLVCQKKNPSWAVPSLARQPRCVRWPWALAVGPWAELPVIPEVAQVIAEGWSQHLLLCPAWAELGPERATRESLLMVTDSCVAWKVSSSK